MLMFKKEKKVVKLLHQHIETTAACVTDTTHRLTRYIADDAPPSWADGNRVGSLESEADTLLREIRDLLYSGAYLPLIRGDIYRLMSSVDSVGNKAEACFDFFSNQAPGIPEQFRSDFLAALNLTDECFEEFKTALEAFLGPKDKVERVRKHSRAVGELESRIDEVERRLTHEIFHSTLEKSEKIHLRQALRRLVAISDAAEDAADELQLISLKSII
jgi:predicted phosphate transport protein (TIGR00153 family)